jgi:hypothetical protein
MFADIYQQMLDEFGDTLEQTSKDSDEEAYPKGRGVFMTASRQKVVNFDKFKESIVRKYGLSDSPNSCDALYMRPENEWVLMEFKNGTIDKKTIHQIRGKIFQSLLLLTEKLKTTICFTRKNMTFILVYNENARIEIGNSLGKLSGTHFSPFGLNSLQKLYFKAVYAWNKKEFDSNFVKNNEGRGGLRVVLAGET